MKSIRRILSLAYFSSAVLRHEWMPTMCLVTALSAVLCPVILILGLKQGTVENLRQSLLREPSNLEIRPRNSLLVNDALLKRIRSFKGTAFIIPKTRSLGSASVELRINDRQTEVDLIPTDVGDPLLITYHQNNPNKDELVLTSSAAKSLEVTTGEMVTMNLGRRTEQGTGESVSLSLRVTGVLPAEATTIRAAYVPLKLLAAVEEYRENLAVPAYGWSGPESQAAEPIYDGFVWIPDASISPDVAGRLSVLTGFLSHRKIEKDDIPASPAFQAFSERGILFYNENNPLPISSIKTADSIQGGRAYAWCRPREIRVANSDGTFYSSWLFTWPNLNDGEVIPKILMALSGNMGKTTQLLVASPPGEVSMPCEISTPPDSTFSGTICATPSFMGILRNLDTRSVTWDPRSSRFLLGRRGFSSFRLYASDLSLVEPLASQLSSMGIDCTSEGAKIARVLRFDSDLTKLFWLVGLFSLTGGSASLVLSLIGAIERRRRDHAMLRVLGLPRGWLFFLPLVEALVIASAAFGVAIAVYHINAAIINRLFDNLGNEASGFCRLPLRLQLFLYLFTLLPALVGSLVAGTRMIRMPLSETIRHV
ncbi:MAG: FtsX-like permease family protein [Luteolibacter sp.]